MILFMRRLYKMKTLYKLLNFSLLLCTISCSQIYGEPENSTGTQSISAAIAEIEFSSVVDSTIYKSIKYTNLSDQDYKLQSIAFVNNDCGDFSLHSLSDTSGNTLADANQVQTVSVSANDAIYFNVQFSPSDCEKTNYTTQLIIYYQKQNTTESSVVNLNASVSGSVSSVICENTEDREYNEDIGDPTPSRLLPVLENNAPYYLKVEIMRAYIQPTGGFASLATEVGTDLKLEDIPEDKRYQPIYLPFYSDGNGNLTLEVIDDCSGFTIPSPVTDTYFLGADLSVTTSSEFYGTVEIEDSENLGNLEFQDVELYLLSNINNTSSLIQNSDGQFGATISITLNSLQSENNRFLPDIADLTDDSGSPFLSIFENGEDSYLIGKNLRHGKTNLVGIGIFEAKDALMSSEATSGLVESEAYLFLEIQATVVTQKE